MLENYLEARSAPAQQEIVEQTSKKEAKYRSFGDQVFIEAKYRLVAYKLLKIECRILFIVLLE